MTLVEFLAALILIDHLFDAYRRKQIQFTIILGLSTVSRLYLFPWVAGDTVKTAVVWYFTYLFIA